MSGNSNHINGAESCKLLYLRCKLTDNLTRLGELSELFATDSESLEDILSKILIRDFGSDNLYKVDKAAFVPKLGVTLQYLIGKDNYNERRK